LRTEIKEKPNVNEMGAQTDQVTFAEAIKEKVLTIEMEVQTDLIERR